MTIRTVLQGIAALGLVIGLAATAPAANRDKAGNKAGNRPRPATAARDAALGQTKQLDKQAGAAEKTSQKDLNKATGANVQIAAAKKALDDAEQNFQKIEKALEDGQPSDSEFGRARDAYQANSEKYTAAADKIKKSEEYKTAYAEADASADRGVAMLELKKRFVFGNPTIMALQTAVEQSCSAYEAARIELHKKSPEWVAAADDLKAKRQELTALNAKFSSSLSAGMRAASEARSAKGAADAAAAAALAARARRDGAANAKKGADKNGPGPGPRN